MDLLYTLTAYPPSVGGAQTHQHEIARYLRSSLLHHIHVISHWDSNRNDWLLGTTLLSPIRYKNYEIDGVPVHRLGLSISDRIKLLPRIALYYPFMQSSVASISLCLESYIANYAKKSDLIHNVRIGRESISYASLKAARRYEIPFILTPVHHPRWVGWRYKVFNKIYCSADAVIALTAAEKRILISLGVNASQIYITGHGPVIAESAYPKTFRKSLGINGSDKIVLFLGQHYRYKGYKQLLDATQLVWNKNPDVHFAFIGPSVGNSEKIFSEYQEPRIHRLGKVDLQTKTNALAACDVLCVPSTQESFGGVYVEAWSFEKPVIACKIEAVSDVVQDDVDGYLVQQEPHEIADRILYVFDNPKNSALLGKRGLAKVESRYTWKRIAEMTENIYRNILSS